MKLARFFLPLWILVLAACNLPARQPSQDNQTLLATTVALTLQAMTPQASPTAVPTIVATPTAVPVTVTPTTSQMNVSGKVCYHHSNVTQLTLYFQDTATNKVVQISVARPQADYQLQLSPGTYSVYGWPPDYSEGVLYNGGSTISVAAGQVLTHVDFCNYSHGPFDVPYPPDYSPKTMTGSVSGSILNYPGDSNAQLTVVAFNHVTGYWYYSILKPGVRTYSIDGLPPGAYQVVAYDKGDKRGGAFTAVVTAGQDTNADVTDWTQNYAPNPLK